MAHQHANEQLTNVDMSYGSASARRQKALTIVLALSVGYMFAEVAGSLLTNSLALLADAGHMLTDVFGLAMALAAIRFARRPATPAKTYGFYRGEILAALINGLILFGIACYILYEAWSRFREPPPVQSVPMLAVAFGGLMVNLIGLRLLHANAGESLNLQGAYLEVLSDLFGSVSVIVAAVLIYFTSWQQVDPLVSALIGVFILPRTFRLLKSALDVLMEATPANMNTTIVEAEMQKVPDVASVHDLHVWTITSGFVAMTAHVVSETDENEQLLRELRSLMKNRFGIEHLTLQVEAPGHTGDGACCNMDPRCLMVGQPHVDIPQSS